MINLNKYIHDLTYGNSRSQQDFLDNSLFSNPNFILNNIVKYAPDYDNLIERELSSYQQIYNVIQEVEIFFSCFHKFNIYPQISIVGGALYDTVLGLEPKDYDICVYIPNSSGRKLGIVESIIHNISEVGYPHKAEDIQRISQTLLNQSISDSSTLIYELLKQHFNVQSKLKTH